MKSDIRVSSTELYKNGLLALEKLKTLNPENKKSLHFTILDFDMPMMNGLEFLESRSNYTSNNLLCICGNHFIAIM